MSCPGDWPDARLTFPLADPLPLSETTVDLAVEVDGARHRFYWRAAGDWEAIGPELDASLISDEAGRGEHASFTGAVVGMVAFDISGRATPADFVRFLYAPG
jgi:xylan 1,4-beta-xylosidase